MEAKAAYMKWNTNQVMEFLVGGVIFIKSAADNARS